jgi:hypothetical protein
MISRCSNPSNPSYDNYGGRGITVCKRWLDSFETFFEDVGRAPSKAHSLGRIENSLGYEPRNVAWQTQSQQCNNMRTNRMIEYRGETCTLMQWVGRLRLRYGLVQQRLDRGWTPERAFTEAPKRTGSNRREE